MKKTSCCLFAMAAAAILVACGNSAEDEKSPAAVALVELQTAKPGDITETVSAYGTAEFAAASAANLSVQVESQVATVLVTAGTPVRRGQALLVLVPTASTRLDLDKSRRDSQAAASERDRLKRLRADGLATESEWQAAVSNAGSAAALHDSLSARVGAAARLSVRAPFAGVVDVLNAQPGDVLAAGTVAARIAAPDALQVRLGLDPRDAQRISVGAKVTLHSLTPGAAPVTATIATLDRRIDPQSRMLGALVRVPGHTTLLAGDALKADVSVAEHVNVLLVPRSALLYDGSQAYLFVAQNQKAARHDVKLGIETATQVEIVQGLTAGDAVVVAGNAVLEDGMAVRTGPMAGPEGDESAS